MAKRKASGPTFIQRSRAVSGREKAIYHQVEGAGTSRVKRQFLGLTDADVAAVTAQLTAGIARIVRKQA